MEKFSLEPSDGCHNDYLEIRDGKYGYSPLIGKFCDSNIPKLPIQSSGQHMWIKFDSDDSIQSDGFKIIYEFKMLQSDVGINMFNRRSMCLIHHHTLFSFLRLFLYRFRMRNGDFASIFRWELIRVVDQLGYREFILYNCYDELS